MTEETGKAKLLRSQSDYLEEQIAKEEQEKPDSPLLPFLRTQMNYLRRAERQRAGLERPWPNPCK